MLVVSLCRTQKSSRASQPRKLSLTSTHVHCLLKPIFPWHSFCFLLLGPHMLFLLCPESAQMKSHFPSGCQGRNDPHDGPRKFLWEDTAGRARPRQELPSRLTAVTPHVELRPVAGKHSEAGEAHCVEGAGHTGWCKGTPTRPGKETPCTVASGAPSEGPALGRLLDT